MSTLDLPPTDTLDTTDPWTEQLAYLGLALLALLAHLWGLGERSLHHDETLHAAYSWFLYSGSGYMHDPLLHGPLLYHIGALVYWLFGDNDMTARLGAALAGTALTLTPYLIRREIGRLAAFLAALYLLISPVFLYYGRFIRHDVYSILCEMLVFAAVVRYVSTQRAAWLYTGALAFGLMYVNQETSYLFLLIVGGPLIAFFVWRIYRPGVAILGVLALIVAVLVFVLPGTATVDGSHTAIRDTTGKMEFTPGPLLGWYPLETDDNAYALRIRNRADNDAGQSLLVNLGTYLQDLAKFFAHPAILMAIGLTLATLGGLWLLIWGRAERSAWWLAQERGEPVVALFASLAIGRRWLIALAIFATTYALFFTAFFTNQLGLITGTTGSLLYWLAQHNVERGGQPSYYYLVQLVIYEPLLLLWASVGFGYLAYAAVQQWRSRLLSVEDAPTAPPTHSLLSIGLVAAWALGAFVIYAWAGEKMPWLTMHVALPLVIIAAWAFQRTIHGFAATDEYQRLIPHPASFAFFATLFSAFLGLCFIQMTAIVGFGEEAIIPPWVVPIVFVLLLAILLIAFSLRWGYSWTIAALAICITCSGALYTTRSAYRLAYQSGDIPREMLVYTQTSPDVMRVVRHLEEASRRRGHDLAMPVIYDNETVWLWYMRNFTAAQRTAPQLSTPPDPAVMAVLLLDENMIQQPQNRQLLAGFVLQRYPLRWWFPEDQLYRLSPGWQQSPLENISLLGQLLRAPFDRRVEGRVWNYLIFRETGEPLGSSDFFVAVRPEIARQIGVGLGGSLVVEAP